MHLALSAACIPQVCLRNEQQKLFSSYQETGFTDVTMAKMELAGMKYSKYNPSILYFGTRADCTAHNNFRQTNIHRSPSNELH